MAPRGSVVLFGLAVLVALTLSAGAPAAGSANWKQAQFVFTGSGRSVYGYPPGRVGKSQSFTVEWRIAWVLKPNEGHAKTVGEKIDGASAYKARSGPSCSGGIKQSPNILAPMDPTGSKGKKTLLGAAVPMFNFLAYVPRCKGTPGEAIAAPYYGPPAYIKHKLGVAEVAFDATNPKSQELQYDPSWKGKGPQGDFASVSWSGRLTVKITR
jgi:hypothetical protein